MFKKLKLECYSDSNYPVLKYEDTKCTVYSFNEAKKFMEKIVDDAAKLEDELVKATAINGKCLNALKEAVLNNNLAPAKEILRELGPILDDGHTTPSQFLNLSKEQQNYFLKNIEPRYGDIYYDLTEKQFYVFNGIDKETNFYYFLTRNICKNKIAALMCSESEIGNTIIPCYSEHRLFELLNKETSKFGTIKIERRINCTITFPEVMKLEPVSGSSFVETLWKAILKLLEP